MPSLKVRCPEVLHSRPGTLVYLERNLAGTNAVAYFCRVVRAVANSVIASLGPNVIKLFAAVIYECS